MIEINNLTTAVRVDEEFLKKTAKIVIDGEKKKAIELSIALVGQKKIKELNKKYRGKNRATDVLSFSDKAMGLGEIVICLSEVKKNAKKFNVSFEKELAKVLIHSVLHLLGYDHEKGEGEEDKSSSSPSSRKRDSVKEAEKMREKEEHYLGQLEIRN